MGINYPAHAFFGVEITQGDEIEPSLVERLEGDCEDSDLLRLPKGISHLMGIGDGFSRCFLCSSHGGAEVDARYGAEVSAILPVRDEKAVAKAMRDYCKEQGLTMVGKPGWLLFTYPC